MQGTAAAALAKMPEEGTTSRSTSPWLLAEGEEAPPLMAGVGPWPSPFISLRILVGGRAKRG